jgi:hypothetical protein
MNLCWLHSCRFPSWDSTWQNSCREHTKPNVDSSRAAGNTLGTLTTSQDYYRLAVSTSSSSGWQVHIMQRNYELNLGLEAVLQPMLNGLRTISTVSAPLLYCNCHANVVGDTGKSLYCFVVVNLAWRIFWEHISASCSRCAGSWAHVFQCPRRHTGMWSCDLLEIHFSDARLHDSRAPHSFVTSGWINSATKVRVMALFQRRKLFIGNKDETF